MAKNSSGGRISTGNTGTRPTGNKMGQQGSKTAPANPRGQKATAPTGIMATGKGPKSKP